MFNIGPLELIVVLIIALLVLGPKRLPEAARSVGRGMREFRGAIAGDHDDEDHEPPASPQAAAIEGPAKPPDPPAPTPAPEAKS